MNGCKFNLAFTSAYVKHTDGNAATRYWGQPIHATWDFVDGVRVDYRANLDREIINYANADANRSWYTTTERVKTQKARVYVEAPAFNVVEDLTNRRRRPHVEWKPGVEDALKRIGVEFTKLRWQQSAGCSCGCSPGFVIEGGPDGHHQFWVKLPGAPTIDESLPARDLTGVML